MTTTPAPTREEIAELIAFIREELETRAACALPPEADGYRESASRALSIAERLPALVEDRNNQAGYASNLFDECVVRRKEINKLIDERDALQEELSLLRAAAAKENDDICQALGKAIGYPWFKDDQATFPGATEDNGVCVGDHVAASIAEEAAKMLLAAKASLRDLAGEVETLKKERNKPCNSAESSLSAARAMIAELREAMVPFAKAFTADGHISIVDIEFDDFHRARAALAKLDATPPDARAEALAATPLPEELATPKSFDEMTEEELLAGLEGLVPPSDARPAETYQSRVNDWVLACFGEEIGADKIERNHRFLEEALEAVQAGGCTRSEAHQLVDYVFDRPVGELWQEVGGVMNTLAAFCTAHGLDMNDCGERELARVWTKVEAIRAKQATKPKHSPLPQYVPSDDLLAETERALAEAVKIMRPFADEAIQYDEWFADEDCDHAGGILVAALRAARAFVEKHGGMK